MKTMMFLIISAVLTAAQTLPERLQKGLFEEEAKHNLPAAIEEYKAVIAEADEQRRLAATAVFRLAESYRKLGREAEAKQMYERLVRDFSDQKHLVERASAQLPKKKADITEINLSPMTNDFSVLARRLDNSPDLLNAPATNSMTFLQHAAVKGDIDLIEFLLKRGAKLDRGAYVSGQGGSTDDPPLVLAVRHGHKRAAEILIKAGANVNGSGNPSPLQVAAEKGYTELSKLLIENGADVNGGFGWTPLHAAARFGFVDEIELLVKSGADLEAMATIEKDITPLITAIIGRRTGSNNDTVAQPEAVVALVRLGANPNNTGGGEEPPLHMAIRNSNWRVFDALIKAPALDVNVTESRGITPLMQAVFYDRRDAAEALLKKGANLNATNRNGYSALHFSVIREGSTMLEFLLKAGADPNLQNEQGYTALHMAAGAPQANYGSDGRLSGLNPGRSNPAKVKLLLTHKANPSLRDNDGVTPLLYAVDQNDAQMVAQLLVAGSDPNNLDCEGNSPLDYAKHSDTTRLLVERGATNSARYSTNTALRFGRASFGVMPGMPIPGSAIPNSHIPTRRVRQDPGEGNTSAPPIPVPNF
jgi:ankyrin repeat protein